jgi:DNA-binding MarR family transcriptional regulator
LTIFVITTIIMAMTEEFQKEIKQSKPFGSREEAVYLGIQKAAEDLKAGFNELFKTRDLTMSQYNVLTILRGAGSDGISCSDIGDRLITKDSDITRMLDRLDGHELIKRERRTDDRRVILAFITSKGLTVLAQLDAPVTRLHKSQLSHLSKKDLDKLSKLLKKARKPNQ